MPYYRCRGWTTSVSVSPNVYQIEKPQNMRLTYFSTLKAYYISRSNQKFLALVILKAFPIPDKSVDTIVTTLINHYLPVHMYPRYILSDNGTELKESVGGSSSKQLSIDSIFTALYHPQSNEKLEVFNKILKPLLMKLCKRDPTCHKYLNQILVSYRVTPNPATMKTSSFLVYGRDPNLPLNQLLEPMQCFLGDP